MSIAPLPPAQQPVIPDWAYDVARARYRVVLQWRDFVARSLERGTKKADATAAYLTSLRAGQILPPAVMDAAGAISIPTLYRWAKMLRESGDNLDALADRRGGWSGGTKRGTRLGADAEALLLAAYIRPTKPSAAMAWEQTKIALEDRGLPVPSYKSALRFIKSYCEDNHHIMVYGREGEKAHSDKVGPYLSRDDSILSVGDILVADGHRMNVQCLNPATGKPCRMTLIGWQDWASRVFVAFEIMLDENTQAIAASLHRAILNLGKLPRAVVIDNGKAFRNKFFDAKADIHAHDGLYARLGILVHHSAPYKARTKIIERWWGDLDRQCMRGLDAYVGASIDDKPAWIKRNEVWHRSRRAARGEDRVPTVREIAEIVKDYAKHKALQKHPTRPETTPWEMFAAGRGPGFSEAEEADLARQFLYRKQISPSRCRFTLYGVEYQSDVLEALYGLDRKVTAHYSHGDLSEVYLYDGAAYIGKARPVATVNPLIALLGTEADMRSLKEKQKEFSALRSDTRKLAARVMDGGMDGANVLEFLPHMLPAAERRREIPGLALMRGDSPQQADALPEFTAEQIAELEDQAARIQAERDAAPPYDMPFFPSEGEKYEWLFQELHFSRTILMPEHRAWMADYERRPEFENRRARYEQLLQTLKHMEASA